LTVDGANYYVFVFRRSRPVMTIRMRRIWRTTQLTWRVRRIVRIAPIVRIIGQLRRNRVRTITAFTNKNNNK
jgi:hypothetical protein